MKRMELVLLSMLGGVCAVASEASEQESASLLDIGTREALYAKATAQDDLLDSTIVCSWADKGERVCLRNKDRINGLFLAGADRIRELELACDSAEEVLAFFKTQTIQFSVLPPDLAEEVAGKVCFEHKDEIQRRVNYLGVELMQTRKKLSDTLEKLSDVQFQLRVRCDASIVRAGEKVQETREVQTWIEGVQLERDKRFWKRAAFVSSATSLASLVIVLWRGRAS